MSKSGLDRKMIVEQAAYMANEVGLEHISLKGLSEKLGIKSPSLYNHIESLEDLKRGVMLYGWSQATNKILRSVAGVSGYEAIRNICYSFYGYAMENPGVFNAMLWYNKYADEESRKATEDLFVVLYKVMDSLNISEENCNHLIRTLRGFLQGFAMLVTNQAFGNPVSIEKSFDISVQVLIEGMKAFEQQG